MNWLTYLIASVVGYFAIAKAASAAESQPAQTTDASGNPVYLDATGAPYDQSAYYDENGYRVYLDATGAPYDPNTYYDENGVPVNKDEMSSNVSAFLDMIGYAEGADYNTLYGSSTFTDFSDHPANLGWKGVKLPDQFCVNAGLTPPCYSTAAGRYQINKRTWNNLRAAGYDLPDFSPASQDSAAYHLLEQRGALPLIESGQIDAAIKAVSPEWASLPYSTAGQPRKSIGQLLAFYSNNGGVYA